MNPFEFGESETIAPVVSSDPRLGASGVGRACVILLAGCLLAACQERTGEGVAVAVRDSAGITIVESAAPRTSGWHLSDEPILRLAENAPVEQAPLDPTAVFADAAGNIYVGDGNQNGWHAVLVYDSAGRFLRKMGGSGRGPGEFGGQLWWAGPFRGDSLVAWDRRGPSMKIFGADGGYARDVPIPRESTRPPPEGTFQFSEGFHGALDDGTLLTTSVGVLDISGGAGPAWYRHFVYAVDPGGSRRDTIGEFAFAQAYWDGSQQQQYWYAPNAVLLPYGDELLYGVPTAFEYRILGREGTVRRIVRKAYTPEPVGAAEADAVRAIFMENAAGVAPPDQLPDLRRRLEATPTASHKPAWSSVLVDADRNVWVERYRWMHPWDLPPDPAPATWDVFDPDGAWLAEVNVPTGVLLLSVGRDRVHGVRIDEMDVRHIVVYGLDRES